MNMGNGLSADNPTVTAAFRSAMMHQFLIVVFLAALLAIVWNTVRTLRYRNGASGTESTDGMTSAYPEPVARRLLRLSFGILWIVDGLLQTQNAMPLGLPSQVVTPAAGSSPGWIQHVVAQGVSIWSDHPVTAAAATVWIQVGVGLFLLVAPRGRWSRTAGLVSAGWGLLVWVFGEAFGGVLGHGASWLFGWPGAALFYVVAGVLLALPDRLWETARLGRVVIRGMGVYFVGAAVLQAWPGRGFWTGAASGGGAQGSVAAMADQMSQISQPSVTASWVRAFGSFDSSHGWAVNAAVVALLFGIGACFLTARPRLVRIGAAVGAALCLATWVLVQDFGFFGGVGTDPNSMIPMTLVFAGGYLALVRLPARAPVVSPEPTAAAETVAVPAGAGVGDGGPAGPGPGDGVPSGVGTTGPDPVPVAAGVGRLARLHPSYLLRCLAAVGALGVVLIGAAPMAVASTSATADPILTTAVNGTPDYVDAPAPAFTLTDQYGTTVTPASLAGHTTALTFLDPTCTSDCPLIAQELKVVDRMLGADAAHVELVAVVANPVFTTSAATRAFDRQEGMDQLPNWHFVTGPLPALHAVWNAYGVQTLVVPAGAMVAHPDLVYVIDGRGRMRVVLSSNPGAQTDTALHSSFSAELTAQLRRFA